MELLVDTLNRSNRKAQFDHLLMCMQTVGFDSDKVAIAGGAIRDTLLGKPVKDIDILVGQHANLTREQSINMIQEFSDYEAEPMGNASGYNSDVWRVPPFQDEFPLPIEIILLDSSLDARLDSFDYDICKVAYNRNGLMLSTQFVRAVETATIRPLEGRLLSPWGNETNHLARIREKYPESEGWKYPNA